MTDFKENKQFVELRKLFYKETNTFAVVNKKGYTKWLEQALLKKMNVIPSSTEFETVEVDKELVKSIDKLQKSNGYKKPTKERF